MPTRTRENAILQLGMIIIPEDIYRYFILDDALKLPDFRSDQESSVSKRFQYVLNPTQPTLCEPSA